MAEVSMEEDASSASSLHGSDLVLGRDELLGLIANKLFDVEDKETKAGLEQRFLALRSRAINEEDVVTELGEFRDELARHISPDLSFAALSRSMSEHNKLTDDSHLTYTRRVSENPSEMVSKLSPDVKSRVETNRSLLHQAANSNVTVWPVVDLSLPGGADEAWSAGHACARRFQEKGETAEVAYGSILTRGNYRSMISKLPRDLREKLPVPGPVNPLVDGEYLSATLVMHFLSVLRMLAGRSSSARVTTVLSGLNKGPKLGNKDIDAALNAGGDVSSVIAGITSSFDIALADGNEKVREAIENRGAPIFLDRFYQEVRDGIADWQVRIVGSMDWVRLSGGKYELRSNLGLRQTLDFVTSALSDPQCQQCVRAAYQAAQEAKRGNKDKPDAGNQQNGNKKRKTGGGGQPDPKRSAVTRAGGEGDAHPQHGGQQQQKPNGRPDPRGKYGQQQQKKRNCKFGRKCNYLLQGTCKHPHTEEEKKSAKSFAETPAGKQKIAQLQAKRQYVNAIGIVSAMQTNPYVQQILFGQPASAGAGAGVAAPAAPAMPNAGGVPLLQRLAQVVPGGGVAALGGQA